MDKKDELVKAIEQAKNQQEEGFNYIYSATYNYTYFRAKTITKNEDDAWDLLQEVYIVAYKSIDKLENPNNLYAWLGGITYNLGMRAFRKNKDVLLTEENESLFEQIEDTNIEFQPEHTIENEATTKIIKELIEQLPVLQRVAILAYYFDELSVGQIAEQFECSAGTIKSRLNYARQSLKQAVEAKEKREGYVLHSITLPTLLWALQLLAKESTVHSDQAQIAYKGICASFQIAATSINTGLAISATKGANVVSATQISQAAAKTASLTAKFIATTTAVKAAIIGTTALVVVAFTGGTIALNNAKDTDNENWLEQVKIAASIEAGNITTDDTLIENTSAEGDSDSQKQEDGLLGADALPETDIQPVADGLYSDDNAIQLFETYLEEYTTPCKLDGVTFPYEAVYKEDIGIYHQATILRGYSGVLTHNYADMNGDNQLEMIMVSLEEDVANSKNLPVLSVFEIIKGNLQKTDFKLPIGLFNDWQDGDSFSIYLRNQKIYMEGEINELRNFSLYVMGVGIEYHTNISESEDQNEIMEEEFEVVDGLLKDHTGYFSGPVLPPIGEMTLDYLLIRCSEVMNYQLSDGKIVEVLLEDGLQSSLEHNFTSQNDKVEFSDEDKKTMTKIIEATIDNPNPLYDEDMNGYIDLSIAFSKNHDASIYQPIIIQIENNEGTIIKFPYINEETTYEETTKDAVLLDSYIGTFQYNNNKIIVSSMDESKISFILSSYSDTSEEKLFKINKSEQTYVGDQVTFFYCDTWSNTGYGTIRFTSQGIELSTTLVSKGDNAQYMTPDYSDALFVKIE